MPGSSLGSDYRARKRPALPGGLQAPVLFGGPAGTRSPTLGFAVPHHGSLSSGGSPPFGVSPLGAPTFGPGAATLHAFGAAGGLHLGLANSRP